MILFKVFNRFHQFSIGHIFVVLNFSYSYTVYKYFVLVASSGILSDYVDNIALSTTLLVGQNVYSGVSSNYLQLSPVWVVLF